MIQNIQALSFGIQRQTTGTRSHRDAMEDAACAIEHADFFRAKRRHIGFVAVRLKYHVERLGQTEITLGRARGRVMVNVRVQINRADLVSGATWSNNSSDPIV